MQDNGLDFKQCIVCVVGNKSDCKNKELDPSDVNAYARKKGYECFICSASSGDNVNELFERMFAKIVEMIETNKQRIAK